jgi:indolepyruvate decarboxylase
MIYKPIRNHDSAKATLIDSNTYAIKEAVQEALTLLNSASKPVLVAGVEVQRFCLQEFVLELLEKTSIPVVSTPLSKSVLNEDHPCYLGVYEGAMGHTDVRKYVESSDCIILLGTFMTDIDFGNSPTPIDQGRIIDSTSQRLVIKYHVYENISTRDFIIALNKKLNDLKKFSKVKFRRKRFTRFRTIEDQKITVNRMFQRLNAFISSKNVVIADTGDALFGGLDLFIHKGTEFLSPAYYLSMGFAIPASIGAQLAEPEIRPVVLVGDGAFQMTGVELTTTAKLNLNPIIILMNNDGFRTERTILDGIFNDIQQWNYGKIIELLGHGKSYTVRTEGQFDMALNEAEKNSRDFALIEVILDRFDSSQALNRLTRALSARVK